MQPCMTRPQAVRPPKTRIEDLRRRELIDAAHRVFFAHGLQGMTTARICAEAGMSPGILAYYFKGKDEVLFAMVRQNNRALAEEVISRLRLARTGWERLLAVIEGNFPAAYFDSGVASAWLSVCAASGREPRYARLQRVFHSRLASNVASALAPGTDPASARRLTLALGSQIDGLWLRKATDTTLTRDEAILVVTATARLYLAETRP
jgi:TetR/AcrR family transcriptional regulator, transcriptional repressor of bet genes